MPTKKKHYPPLSPAQIKALTKELAFGWSRAVASKRAGIDYEHMCWCARHQRGVINILGKYDIKAYKLYGFPTPELTKPKAAEGPAIAPIKTVVDFVLPRGVVGL